MIPLSNLFKTNIAFQPVNNRSQFRTLLNYGYENILLFTHASAATPDPHFQLSNDTFYLSDLYGSRIHANLVLLAACETGIGINQKGEGILSIARGFCVSGCPSYYYEFMGSKKYRDYEAVTRLLSPLPKPRP